MGDMIDELDSEHLKLCARFFYDTIDLHAISDLSGKVIDVNDAMLETFGFTREEILGSSWADFVCEADIGAMAREFEKLVTHGRSKGFLSRLKCKTGEYKLIEWDSNISHTGQEILCLGRDVSDSRRAYESLNGQISLQRAIIDSAEFSIVSIDLEGKIQTFNRTAERLFGYSAPEVIGKMSPSVFFREHELHSYALEINRSFGMPVGEHLDSLLFKPRAGLIEERTFTLRKKNNIEFPAFVTISPLSHERVCHGFLFIARDKTEETRVANLKNEFISTVSHELRTPMTSIRGSLGLIAGGVAGVISDEAKPLIDIAISGTDRLIRLINDILDIEKIESGKMEFNMKTVEITPLVQEAITANRSFAEHHKVQFRLTRSVPNVWINADVDRFAQILDNLLSNAAKYTSEGDQVEIEISEQNDKVRVSVIDHGPGIPNSFRGKVFSKFMQANASDTRKKGGTGLGLATCKALVENQGGAINFESKEGEGSTFFFEFPIQP